MANMLHRAAFEQWVKQSTSLMNLAWRVLCGIISMIRFAKKLFQQRTAVYEVRRPS